MAIDILVLLVMAANLVDWLLVRPSAFLAPTRGACALVFNSWLVALALTSFLSFLQLAGQPSYWWSLMAKPSTPLFTAWSAISIWYRHPGRASATPRSTAQHGAAADGRAQAGARS